jgi:TRAP-type mannitol/chloroaromatic compound transport system permease large subunit
VLTGLYIGYVALIALFRPGMAPALPPEARTYREPNGASGMKSLAALTAVSIFVAFAFEQWYSNRHPKAGVEELVILSMMASLGAAFVLAMANRLLKLNLLSKIAERVTFVLIPPLALIFLVLGTIFLGIATPTEGGAMGAVGALIMAVSRRRLSWPLLKQAMDTTAKLSTFVIFILIGATIFNLSFQGVDGNKWVEHLLADLPGGQLGFLIVVNVLVFLLAFFLDFFELAFIIVPLLAPVAEKLDINLIWFGVLLAVNMQTSFMHPPFGFALFYLRSVAAQDDYIDKVTGQKIAKVTTGQIYWGAVPFVCIQLIMVAIVIAFPGLVTSALGDLEPVDVEKIQIELPPSEPEQLDPAKGFGIPGPAPGTEAPKSEEEDPNAAVLRALEREGKK